MMTVDVLVNVFANSPPAICIALGFVLLFFGYTVNNSSMMNAGWIFVAIGVLLQVFWLFVISKRS